MKKLLVLTLVLVLVVALVAGCSSQNSQQQQQPQEQQNQQSEQPQQTALKDGTYYAENKEFDDHGWKGLVTVIVKDGKITNVFYDEINQEGKLKSFDPEYGPRMKEKSGITPLEAYPKLEQALVEKQKPEDVDAVAGATHSSDSFKNLAAEALKGSPVEAKDGLKNGLYKAAEADFDDHGWKAIAAVIVKDGKIQSAFFDEVNKDDGRYKLTDQEYAKNMEAKSGTTPAKAVEALTKSLIEKQNVEQVDAVTGATGTTAKYKDLMTKALSLAK
ncbi:FMN-binding protein [Thermosediminibacter litoriperuensis]|uniref:Major membrane immunogen (Membrane-anchored lipoprotein) n=1 Tax=Thermosediminibacter litoriperuensis TaxID=291989 RepID=A0A5S5AWV8_9FIRM|nr:FMN-binding protein [Thermosediminibacter litoriperuensis]TYP57839.1 major membrane immunogen (membrane-anchored lipoprotein) [Thermosediminibacter litoriperuensis]